MKTRAFTIVELLIVVIILGILASIGIPQFGSALEKSKAAEAKQGLYRIETEERLFEADRRFYSSSFTELNLTDLSQRYWTFSIQTPTSSTYTATATRSGGGSRSGQTITKDQTGTFGGNWEFLGTY